LSLLKGSQWQITEAHAAAEQTSRCSASVSSFVDIFSHLRDMHNDINLIDRMCPSSCSFQVVSQSCKHVAVFQADECSTTTPCFSISRLSWKLSQFFKEKKCIRIVLINECCTFRCYIDRPRRESSYFGSPHLLAGEINEVANCLCQFENKKQKSGQIRNT
jgi:hypothetical protein